MENYDVNVQFCKSIIEVTIQIWEYIGHYRLALEGNVKGASIIDSALDVDDLCNEIIVWSDCQLKISENSEGDEIYEVILTDKLGNTLESVSFLEELGDYIVGVNIIDYQNCD